MMHFSSNRNASSKGQYPAKRKRLSHACNYCRSQKRRCDEGKPACRNCLNAGKECITTDLRKPGAPQVARRRARSPSPDLVFDSQSPARYPDARSTISTASISSRGGSSAHRQLLQDGLSPASARSFNDESYESETIDSRIRRDSMASLSSSQHSSAAFALTSMRRNGIDQRPRNPNGETYYPKGSHSPADPTIPDSALDNSITAAVNKDDTTTRQKYLGASSLQVFAEWVDLSLKAHGVLEDLSAGFRHGMRYAEEFNPPISCSLPRLRDFIDPEEHLNTYLRCINPIYPFLDEQKPLRLLEKFRVYEDMNTISSEEASELACLYCMISIGLRESEGPASATSDYLLKAAYSLLGHIIAHPYISSVQTLGVMALALRGRLKDGVASQILGQTIRIAHSIGLHRHHTPKSSEDLTHESRTWWACYCMERNMAFETGRPSMVDDDEIDMPLIGLHGDEPDYLAALVSLSRIQGRISKEVFGRRSNQMSAQKMIPLLAHFDSQLSQWTDRVPEIIRYALPKNSRNASSRPGREVFVCSREMLPFASVLAFQYYTTLSMIHRAALLLDGRYHSERVRAAELPSSLKQRLISGASICASAGRSIIRSVEDLLQHYGPSQLFDPTQCFLAVYILVIHIMRHPTSWTVSADLELIKKATLGLTMVYSENGQDTRFISMFSKLYNLAASTARKASTKAGGERHPSMPWIRRKSLSSHSRPGRVDSMATEQNVRTLGSPYAIGNPPTAGDSTAEYHGHFNTESLGQAYDSALESQEANQSGRSHPPLQQEGEHFSPDALDRLWATTFSDSINILQSANGPYDASRELPSEALDIPVSNGYRSPDALDVQLQHGDDMQPGLISITMQDARDLFGLPHMDDLGLELQSLFHEH